MKQPNKQNAKKPIFVKTKTDPRYIAYQDSLVLYNKTKDFIKAVKTDKGNLTNLQNKQLEQYTDKIKPIGEDYVTSNTYSGTYLYDIYKYPKQPVIVGKEKNSNIVKNLDKSKKNLPNTQAYIDSATVYNWGQKKKKQLIDSDTPGEFKETMINKTKSGYYDTLETGYPKDVQKAVTRLEKLNNKPVNAINVYKKDFNILGIPTGTATTPIFKKPTKPVIKEDIRKPNTSTGKQVKEQGTRGMIFNETLKRKPIVPINTLNSEEVKKDNTITPVDIKVPVVTKKAKSYKVEENTPNQFGGHTSTYEVSDINNINNSTMTGKNTRKITPTYANGGSIGDTIVPKKVQTPIIVPTLTPTQKAYREKREAQKAKNAIRLAPLEAARAKRILASGLSKEDYNKREEANSKGRLGTDNLDVDTANKRGKAKGSCTTGVKNEGESIVDVKRNGGIIKAAGGAAILGSLAPLANAIPVAGPAVSAVMSIGSAVLGANEAKKAAEKEALLRQRTNLDASNVEQEVYNNQFIKDNVDDLPVYAKGGNMNQTTNPINPSNTGKYDTVGGDLVPISDDAEVVVGNKHTENKIDGSYGVTLSEDGQPIANVEDKEVVVDDNLVFSDKLKRGNETFANLALKINKQIGDLQVKKESAKGAAENFSIDRTIEGLENKNKNLFKEQELVKQNTIGDKEEQVVVENGVVPKGETGLNLFGKSKYKTNYPSVVKGDITAAYGKPEDKENTLAKYKDLIPMAADNVANLILTNNAPKPVAPLARRAPILDTTVNINPTLAAIQNSVNKGNAVISNNTNNSAVARANITANNLRGMEASTNAMGNKESQEIVLRNNQNKVLADNANTNAELNDQHQWDVYQNKLEKNASYSENVSNLVQDYTAVKKDINTDDRENAILELDALRDPTGQTARDLEKTKAIMLKRKQRLLRK